MHFLTTELTNPLEMLVWDNAVDSDAGEKGARDARASTSAIKTIPLPSGFCRGLFADASQSSVDFWLLRLIAR